jgi:hypothetical protein
MRGSLRGLTLGAALCWCIAPGADRVSLAAPRDELIAALSVADGDQCSIQTTQEPKGRTKVVVRGDHFDGRRFLRVIFAELTEVDSNSSAFDIDLDMKLTTLTGFNGQALHDVTLKFAGREMLEFGLPSKLDRADFLGELGSGRDGRRMIYLEVNDAGAFFRFTNVYQHIKKGRLRVAMDIADRNGIFTVDDFSLVGDPTLKSIYKSDAEELKLSQLRFGFQMLPHRVVVNDGLLRGPTLAATISGKIDIANNDLNLRGTLFPIYASDLGLFQPNLHWGQEGWFSLNYGVTGLLRNPVVQINPFGDPAPGLLRKLFARDWDNK